MDNPPPFHPNITKGYGDNSVAKALADGTITEEDAHLIRDYATEYQSTRHVSDLRVLKTIFELVNWRRFLKKPYNQLTMPDVHSGIDTIKHAKSKRGKPYAVNTLHDYVKILRWFLVWLVENDYLEARTGNAAISIAKIRKVKVPAVNYETTPEGGILTRDEVMAIVTASKSPRTRALLMLLYETGGRVQEVARLRWRDVEFDSYGVRVRLADTKTSKTRFIRCRAVTDYLATWRAQYPNGAPEGDAMIFPDTRTGLPIQYPAVARLLSRAVKESGIDPNKRVHPHLFRKTRITHLLGENIQESILKKAMWGNVGTNMLRTYAVLDEQAIDDEFLRRQGVDIKRKAEQPIIPGECPHCGTLVAPDSQFCRVCGQDLTQEAAANESNTLSILIDLAKRDPDGLVEALKKLG